MRRLNILKIPETFPGNVVTPKASRLYKFRSIQKIFAVYRSFPNLLRPAYDTIRANSSCSQTFL
jgi:hypothetical protein